jgi:hypothetical protein
MRAVLLAIDVLSYQVGRRMSYPMTGGTRQRGRGFIRI